MTLAKSGVERESDRKQVQKVGSPRLVETPFRSPQLTLFDGGPGEWGLYWRTPDYAPRVRKRRTPGLVQPPLFDLQPVEKVVGGNDISVAPSPHSYLYLAPRRVYHAGNRRVDILLGSWPGT